MHPANIHNEAYDLTALVVKHTELEKYIYINKFGNKTIDFSNPAAVLHLNKALLKYHYHITEWNIPGNYLCPPIPGRADYIHHLAGLISAENIPQEKIKGLDIGVGANCIYPILGAQIYNWKMVGADIDATAVKAAQNNVEGTAGLQELIEIRHQPDPAHIFKGIIKETEQYTFSMCNPPFHASEKDAIKASKLKMKNLGQTNNQPLNFGGQANELWCNGGEALFIKRMIRESVPFQNKVRFFTSLVSKKENLQKITKQLQKLKADHKIIEMDLGNKKSRILVWSFNHLL